MPESLDAHVQEAVVLVVVVGQTEVSCWWHLWPHLFFVDLLIILVGNMRNLVPSSSWSLLRLALSKRTLEILVFLSLNHRTLL